MKLLLTHLRTFFETWMGTCDIYINSRGHLTGQVSLLWFAPREINFPAESVISSKFIPLASYTPPSILTRVHYVLPPTKPEPNSNTPTVHIPIRPRAPSA